MSITGKPDQNFEDVIEVVGKNGPFQKRFNLLFNFGLVICISMANINIVIAMSVPEHWCFVPGREYTNYTEEEWKKLNIPSSLNLGGKSTYEKCTMYPNNYNYTNLTTIVINKTECNFGWEYDKTWFQQTVPSSENWVCKNSIIVSNTFAIMRVADVVGMFIGGQLGDIIGRRPIFIISIILVVSGNLLFTVTSTNVMLFYTAAFIAGCMSYTAYQAPLVIGMEISRDKDKTYIAMLQNIGRTIGLCVLPLNMWYIKYWKPFMVISSLPCLLFLLPYKYIIESPRWLASKGKSTNSLKVLKKIAKINKSNVPEDASYVLRTVSEEKEKIYGAMSMFSSLRMARNSVCLIICWVVSFTSYLILTLNISNLDGNPFLNFVYQGAIELPAIFLGKYFSDKFGRKWTNVGSFVALFLGSIPALFIANDPNSPWFLIGCAVFLKFAVMLSYYVVGLQSVEMYPTCLRQTGVAVCGLSASSLGALAPYAVHLGTSIDARYPYVITAGLSLVASVCGALLPETSKNSPNTLEEAKNFGKYQKCSQNEN